MIPIKELIYRRQQVIAQLPSQALAVVSAAHLKTRSNDTHYPFRQDSDYWYLTGVDEPEGCLFFYKSEQGATQTWLFVLPRDPQDEIWHGRRLGTEQAKLQTGVDACFSVDEFEAVLKPLLPACKTIYTNQTAEKALDIQLWELYTQAAADQAPAKTLKPLDITPMIHELRVIKSPYEQELIRKAAQISADAHLRAMRFTQAGHYEYQVAAELHHEFAMQGAAAPAYGTICAGGENACILHYTENNAELKADELLLIDAGAEYQGYAGDISRTFPVGASFSPAQAALYDLVLAAQQAALTKIRPGSTLPSAYRACVKVLVQGLVDLGILSGSVETLMKTQAFRPYFMHGLGHWLGLDVHDAGDYQEAGQPRKLQAGMVLTIEPGLYIPKGSACPSQYWGIGIRIEDNILVTTAGYENLTEQVPKTRTEIEAIRAVSYQV